MRACAYLVRGTVSPIFTSSRSVNAKIILPTCHVHILCSLPPVNWKLCFGHIWRISRNLVGSLGVRHSAPHGISNDDGDPHGERSIS